MRLSEAIIHATRIKESLKPYCQRIEIGGSIRRKSSMVKDVEIICIPKMRTPKLRTSAWCNAVFGIGLCVKGLSGRGTLNTAKYMKFRTKDGVAVDLFVATPENWGMTLFIRTGSADFVKRAFGAFNKKGFISVDGVHQNKEGKKLYFKEESEIFDFFNTKFVEPEKRI